MNRLRASGKATDDDYRLEGVITEDAAVGVDQEDELLAFADAAVNGEQSELASARQLVVDSLGVDAMVDAAAIIAGFNGITRIADATGIPVEPRKLAETEEWRAALGIDRFMAGKT